MKWKIIIIVSIPIVMGLIIMGIMIFGHTSKEEIQNLQEKYGLGGKMQQLEQGFEQKQSGVIYTPTSETICTLNPDEKTKTCTQTSYSFNAFLDEQGHTFSDLSNFYYSNGDFIFEFNGTKTIIRPYSIIGGKKVYLKDLTLTTTNNITKNRFDWKYSFDISGVALTPSTTISSIGFEIINKSKQIDLSYDDLIKSNFSVNKDNPNDIIVTNIASNVKGGKLSLDPTVQLNSGNVTLDNWNTVGTKPVKYGFQMRWLITSIPAGATINNVTICLNETATGTTMPDNDLNMSRINNQTWVFGDWGTLNSQMTNSTTAYNWLNETGGTILSEGKFWCANVTTQFITDYNLGNSYTSFRFNDPDGSSFTEGTLASDTNLYFGTSGDFADSSHSTVSSRPYMNVTYTAETTPPIVNLLAPANNSYNNISQNVTLSCNVTDASNLASNKFYTNRRGGAWEIANSNTTAIGATSAVYNYSFLPTRTYYDGLQYCDLDNSLVNHSSRSMKQLNSTHWVFAGYQTDRTYILNSTCGNVNNWASPGTNIQDVYSNDTFIWMADWVSQTIYIQDKSGNNIGNYVLPDYMWGIDSNDNGQTLWITNYTSGVGATFRHIWSMNGTEISRFSSSRPLNNQYLVVSNTTLWTIDFYNNPDQIAEYDLTTGTNTYNISFTTIGDTSDTQLKKGLAKDFNDNIVDRLYVSHVSTNELTAIERNTTGPITWNCYACDIYNNCAFNSTNWSYNYGTAPSANCWTYDAGTKLLTIPVGCLYNCSGTRCPI